MGLVCGAWRPDSGVNYDVRAAEREGRHDPRVYRVTGLEGKRVGALGLDSPRSSRSMAHRPDDSTPCVDDQEPDDIWIVGREPEVRVTGEFVVGLGHGF